MNADVLYVTGASGFVGSHLTAMAKEGVFGNCRLALASDGLDVRDLTALKEEIAREKPTRVIHLAARSFVPASFAEPGKTFDVNLLGTLHLIEALQASQFQGRLLYVSSGDVYGAVPESALPVQESRQAEPRSPYGVSKVAAELLCRQYHYSAKLDVVVARPFNHIGPGQGAQFVVPGLAEQVVRISEGSQPPRIEVGDIDVTRDFSDVRDVVRAYAMLLESGRAGEVYNIASGREVRVRDILQKLLILAGVEAEIVQDPGRMRPSEQRRMVASSEKLRRDTGWQAEIPLDTSLTQILETFRTKDTR